MATYYQIGCGGIGGWLSNLLVKTLTSRDKLILVDGDVIEEKNLDRQLFDKGDLGLNKAEATHKKLASGARCSVAVECEYLGANNDFQFQPDPDNWVIVGADNHPARLLALDMADSAGIKFLSAANGYEEAEAFFYTPSWEGSKLDPRVYYPEITTGKAGDPLSPPCTGEVLESAPQLAIANMSAASYAMWLMWFWREKFPTLPHDDEDVMDTVPYHVLSTAGRIRIRTLKDHKEVEDGNVSD